MPGRPALEIVGAFLLAGAAGVALGVATAWSPLLATALSCSSSCVQKLVENRPVRALGCRIAQDR